jgi:DNA-binding transcriptional LysR family regulator
MNVRSLQCFIKVYEKKSINAAAREVFLSPQGLSKVIKQLEVDLDAELFSRGTQGMEATESGELLYARARHVCYLMEDIKKEIGIINGGNGSLNVVMTASAALVVSPDVVFGFSERNPNLRLRLREVPDEHPLGELFQDEADVGIVMGHEGLKECHYEPLIRGQVVALVAPNHRWALRDEVSLAELADEPLVLRAVEEGTDHRVVEKFLELGLTPRVRHETGNLQTLHQMCAGGAVAISVDLLEAAVPDDGVKVLRLREPIFENISLVSRKREIQNRAVSSFQQYLFDLVRTRP